MEFQLQLYLVMGVGGGLIAALILSTAILIYYMVKLNERISRDSYRRQSQGNSRINAYNNPALNLDDELHRRFTQYTPEPTIEREKKTKSNKGSVNSQNIRNVIDVSEEFRWKQSDRPQRPVSQFNNNIVLQDEKFMSMHEGRTYFNEREYN